MVNKPFTVLLLSCSSPEFQDRYNFMRHFIGNMNGKKAHYKNLTLYINRQDRIGVFGNYEHPRGMPFDHDYELVLKEFLTTFAKDEVGPGYVWAIENRGVFSSSFLEFLHSIAKVKRLPVRHDQAQH